jgi:multidrug resistance efflux pump
MTRKSILATTGLLAAVALGLGFYWPLSHSKRGLRLPGVVEIQEVRLSSKVGGRVARVAVAEGNLVQPGQPLVYFDVPELQAQYEQMQARLQAAEADLEKARNGARVEEKAAARAARDAARSRWERLKAGSRVEEIEQAQSELASAEADLKGARKEAERSTTLYARKAVSGTDYDAAVTALERAQGRASAARARLKLLQAGSRPEEIAEAAAELARAQANFDLLEAGTRSEDIAQAQARVAELKAKVRELKVNLQEAVVVAPEHAVVEVLPVRKGDIVPPNQPVVRVLRAEDLWVKVYVPETELGKVRLGQEVEVKIDGYPDKSFAGVIQQIASESEFTPRNIQSVDERRHQVFGVKVRVANPDGVFKSGMAADVLLKEVKHVGD